MIWRRESRHKYLSLVLADGDPAEVRDALNVVARAQGMSEVAKAAGVSREGLYKTLGEDGNPEFATVLRVIGAGHRSLGNPPFGAGSRCQAEEEEEEGCGVTAESKEICTGWDIRAVALAAVILITAFPALAESPYCVPKADGIYRFPKTGAACPTGYFAAGNCCEALHRDTPRAMPRIDGAACPSGYFASGGACKAFR